MIRDRKEYDLIRPVMEEYFVSPVASSIIESGLLRDEQKTLEVEVIASVPEARDRRAMLLHNLGGVFSGDASAPTADQDAIAISDGLIVAPGRRSRRTRASGWTRPAAGRCRAVGRRTEPVFR